MDGVDGADGTDGTHGVAPGWDRPWLSRRFLRDYISAQTVGQELLDDDTAWRHPLVRDHFPAGVREAMVRLRQDREWFLGIMESLPGCGCGARPRSVGCDTSPCSGACTSTASRRSRTSPS
ncbi:hypothetical protein ACFXKC_18575 [Streptomyces sp. NPDC059340]|uniref:hypothetical protein n=1 Tax=Streptomyces sp. NPDC059340 TaxID=3346806 RepID=UPI0036927585